MSDEPAILHMKQDVAEFVDLLTSYALKAVLVAAFGGKVPSRDEVENKEKTPSSVELTTRALTHDDRVMAQILLKIATNPELLRRVLVSLRSLRAQLPGR